jgi:hypothetical protein
MRAAGTGLVSAAGDGRDLFVSVTFGKLTGREIAPQLAAV